MKKGEGKNNVWTPVSAINHLGLLAFFLLFSRFGVWERKGWGATVLSGGGAPNPTHTCWTVFFVTQRSRFFSGKMLLCFYGCCLSILKKSKIFVSRPPYPILIAAI